MPVNLNEAAGSASRRAAAPPAVPTALALALVALLAWLQRSFWLNQCPGQIGWSCGSDWRDLQRVFILETFLCAGVAILGVFLAHGGATEQLYRKLDKVSAQRATVVACVAAVAAPLFIAWSTLDRFPNSSDEYAYIFQAHSFSKFRLWETPPVLGADLIPQRTWIFDHKWISQYPPGWALVLAAGSLLGLPLWTINPIIGGASVAALAIFCRLIADDRAAAGAAALYALTPFYAMNAASYFPHVFSSLMILCACLCLQRDAASGWRKRLAGAGACLGAMAATRYFDVLALAPAMLLWLFRTRPTLWPQKIALLAAGFAPFAASILFYQYAVLDSPFRSTYSIIESPDASLSLDPAALTVGFLLIETRLAELAVWTSPVLLVVYFFSLAAKWRARSIAFYDLIFPGFVIAYVAFGSLGGNRYGPRYYMDAYPLIFATIVSAGPAISTIMPGPIARRSALVGVVICLLCLVAVWPLAIVGFSRQVFGREESFRLAAEKGLTNAVVIDMRGDDFVRNPPTMDAPALFARPAADVDALRRAFPQRSIWRYSPPDGERPGQLVRVAPPLEN